MLVTLFAVVEDEVLVEVAVAAVIWTEKVQEVDGVDQTQENRVAHTMQEGVVVASVAGVVAEVIAAQPAMVVVGAIVGIRLRQSSHHLMTKPLFLL